MAEHLQEPPQQKAPDFSGHKKHPPRMMRSYQDTHTSGQTRRDGNWQPLMTAKVPEPPHGAITGEGKEYEDPTNDTKKPDAPLPTPNNTIGFQNASGGQQIMDVKLNDKGFVQEYFPRGAPTDTKPIGRDGLRAMTAEGATAAQTSPTASAGSAAGLDLSQQKIALPDRTRVDYSFAPTGNS